MSAPRRLFFALWPDDATRQSLCHWQTHNLPHDVRWQHRADLHLTLHFLGPIEPRGVAELRSLGARCCVAGTFALVLDAIGHWPRAQVLWAGPNAIPGELVALHVCLGEGLNALGHPVESRAFRPHVTLARKVRRMPGPGPLPPLTWTVREVALVESRPGAAPMYRPVARWVLR
jgi:2'-5' RNA ligase